MLSEIWLCYCWEGYNIKINIWKLFWILLQTGYKTIIIYQRQFWDRNDEQKEK